MQEMDDIELLCEYAERDSEAAFAGIVARHLNQVYSVALRHAGNPHAAEEITQAVFVILATKARRLNRRVILSGWLYETARLTALTCIRSEIRRARREEAHMQSILNESESDSSRQSGAEAEVWTQIAPLLDAALAKLNETDRHAVVLRFFDGKSMKEVGAALGANEDAAKKRVSRALEKLRKIFTKRGVVSTTNIIAGAISANSVQAAPAALAKTVTAVALAKGAAASASTLTLIQGALKIMAWTKVKMAVVVGAGVLLVAGATMTNAKWPLLSHAEIRFEAKGTVTYTAIFPNATYIKTKKFIASRNADHWKIRTIFEKEEFTGNPQAGNSTNFDLYYEMGFDGTNLFTLHQQDKDKLLPTISLKEHPLDKWIFADGRVEKRNSPPNMDTEQLCPIWLAYCSAPYLANLKDSKVVSPQFAIGNFLNEASRPMQLPAKWNMNGRFFINDISWFSDGNTEISGPDGKISIQKYRAPYNGSFLYGRFENSSWTNWNGLALPSSFKLVAYRPSYQEGPNAKPTFAVAYTINGTLESISKLEAFTPVPHLNMKTHITDSRIMRGGRPISYTSTNLWDYSDAMP